MMWAHRSGHSLFAHNFLIQIEISSRKEDRAQPMAQRRVSLAHLDPIK